MFDRSARVSFAGVAINPITDLRISFEVDKHDGEDLNRAIVKIYNMRPNDRNQIARPFSLGFALVEPVIRVFLKVGYKGKEVQIIGGELMAATNEKDGADWITTLEIWSGINAATKGSVKLSIGERTTAKVIADRLLGDLGIDYRYTEQAAEVLTRSRVSDYTAYGLAFRESVIFLRRYGLAFTIEDDGQGLVYFENVPRVPGEVQTLDNTFSPATGLIGAPAITRNGVEFRALLRPGIKLLQKIYLESKTLTGTLRGKVAADYHVVNIKHAGDTRGDEWFTEIEASYSNLISGVYAG